MTDSKKPDPKQTTKKPTPDKEVMSDKFNMDTSGIVWDDPKIQAQWDAAHGKTSTDKKPKTTDK
jgi:hypothetical protein